MIYILMYLIAIILANLTVSWFGSRMVIVNAFLFIGLDLTSRDYLHEKWHHDKLILKMSILIASGSIFTYLINRNAGQIALASFTAFACASIADTLIYHLLKEKVYLVKVNGSNVVSATVDSILFPTIAFGIFMPLIILGEIIAKISGGFIWSLILKKFKND